MMTSDNEREAILALCRDDGVEPDEYLLALPLDLAIAAIADVVIERNRERARAERLDG